MAKRPFGFPIASTSPKGYDSPVPVTSTPVPAAQVDLASGRMADSSNTSSSPGARRGGRDDGRMIQGVSSLTWFGPLQPLYPVVDPSQADNLGVLGRQYDYPVGYNLRIIPRQEESVSFDQLRGLADSLDLLRIVLETRKDQLAKLQWRIVSKRGKKVSQSRLDEIKDFWESPDKQNSWDDWLRALLEDRFVIDAATVYPRPTKKGEASGTSKGNTYSFELLDGATVKPLIDARGRLPEPPGVAYQQIIKGMPVVEYTRDELIYKPRNVRTNHVYGYPEVEQIMMTVNIALRRQLHILQFYTEGNVPESLCSVPKEWSVDQITQYQDYWDSILEGNTAERRHMKFIPDGSHFIMTKEAALKNDFDEWLARVICFTFSIPPTAFVKMTNRAGAQQQQQQALQEGLVPMMKWIANFINYLIKNYLMEPDVVFEWEEEADVDPYVQAQTLGIYVDKGIQTPEQCANRLGLDWAPPSPTEIEPGDVKAIVGGPGGSPGKIRQQGAPNRRPDGQPPATAGRKNKLPEGVAGASESASKIAEVSLEIDVLEKGGEGSGYFGHQGRIGEVGGSSDGNKEDAEGSPGEKIPSTKDALISAGTHMTAGMAGMYAGEALVAPLAVASGPLAPVVEIAGGAVGSTVGDVAADLIDELRTKVKGPSHSVKDVAEDLAGNAAWIASIRAIKPVWRGAKALLHRSEEEGEMGKAGYRELPSIPFDRPSTQRAGKEITNRLNSFFIKSRKDFLNQAKAQVLRKGGEGSLIKSLGIDEEANQAATSPMNLKPEPTDRQKEAGNYPKGHIKVHGLEISIENPQHSIRAGSKSRPDKTWQSLSPAHYGYIRRTIGADGDQLDCYVTNNPEDSDQIFIIDQVDPSTKEFDEHKIVIGAKTPEDAKLIYHSGFSDGSSQDRIGGITQMSVHDFKSWIKGNTAYLLAKGGTGSGDKGHSGRPGKVGGSGESWGRLPKEGILHSEVNSGSADEDPVKDFMDSVRGWSEDIRQFYNEMSDSDIMQVLANAIKGTKDMPSQSIAEFVSHFRHLGVNDIADRIERVAFKLIKSDDDLQRIIDGINTEDWTIIGSEFQPYLERVFSETGAQTLQNLGMGGTVDKEAAKYAKRRSADMVGISDDAQWSITNTTRKKIRDIITKAVKEGSDPEDVADRIESLTNESDVFSPSRAKMIARTELGFAHMAGANAAYRKIQAAGYPLEKKWVTSPSCIHDECIDNEKDGWIDYDEDFSSGDLMPLAHPNCQCDMITRAAEIEKGGSGSGDFGHAGRHGEVGGSFPNFSIGEIALAEAKAKGEAND